MVASLTLPFNAARLAEISNLLTQEHGMLLRCRFEDGSAVFFIPATKRDTLLI